MLLQKGGASAHLRRSWFGRCPRSVLVLPSSKWLVFEAVKLVLCGGSHEHGAKFGDFYWWWPNPGCSDAVCHQTGILRDGLCFRWCSSDDVARFGKTPVTVQKQQQSTPYVLVPTHCNEPSRPFSLARPVVTRSDRKTWYECQNLTRPRGPSRRNGLNWRLALTNTSKCRDDLLPSV